MMLGQGLVWWWLTALAFTSPVRVRGMGWSYLEAIFLVLPSDMFYLPHLAMLAAIVLGIRTARLSLDGLGRVAAGFGGALLLAAWFNEAISPGSGAQRAIQYAAADPGRFHITYVAAGFFILAGVAVTFRGNFGNRSRSGPGA